MTAFSIATDFTDDGGPVEPKLALIAEAGFTHIHWCEHWSRDVLYETFYCAGVRHALETHGLRLLDTHGAQTPAASPSSEDDKARRRGVRLLRNRIEFTAELGGETVVLHPPPNDADKVKQPTVRWDRLAHSIDEVADLCESVGVRLALENVARPTSELFSTFLERYPTSLLGFCFDSGHANIAGEPNLIERFTGRLIALHLNDNQGLKDDHQIPGQGTVNWTPVMHALRGIAYAKPLNFELALRDPETPVRDFLHEAHRAACTLTVL